MKKAIVILLGGFLFSFLFYKQGIGLNALIYAIFILVSLLVCNKNVFLNGKVLLFATLFLSTSIAVFVHRSSLTGFMYLMNLFLFIGMVAESRTSMITTWFNGFYNILLGSFHNLIHGIKPTENEHKMKFEQVIKIVIIPIVLLVVFLLLYRNANPILAQAFHTNIDYTFGVFALLGAGFTANIARPKAAKVPTASDINTPDILRPSVEINQKKVKNEMQIGELSLAVLNILLLVVLVTEMLFLFQLQKYGAVALSKAVHAGVNSSIASIILAIVVIVYCFRGDINFINKNQRIKQLAYLWIALNFLLSISIFVKNFQYISGHGLTLKRLGVMLYLLLCIVGLYTTFQKIQEKKNIRFLINRNMSIGFIVLTVYALFNWSAIVTRYNFSNDFIDLNKTSDQRHILNMLPQNSIILEEYNITQDDFDANYHWRFKRKEKALRYNHWQEMTYLGLQKKDYQIEEE